MADNLDMMDKITKVAKIEEIVSTLKSGSLPFQMFVLFISNDEKGRKLVDEFNAKVEDITNYITAFIKEKDIADSSTIHNGILASYGHELAKNGDEINDIEV